MDLTNLRDSLDVSSREGHPASTSAKKSELRLTRDFKAAALQLTTLYRTSLSSAKRSYASGYAQSLQDILDVVLLRLQQSPASAPGYSTQLHHQQHQHFHHGQESNREELMWLVRYLRARIEAIKAESEDEEERDSGDEEEETQIGGERKTQPASASDVVKTPTSVSSEHVEALKGQDITPEEVADLQTASMMNGEGEGIAQQQVRVEVPDAPPSSSSFTFSPPISSMQTFPNTSVPTRNSPQGVLRRKVKGGPTSNMTPVVVPTTSVSSEEEASIVALPQTPSKRLASRLGKRSSGREKTGALDIFGKSVSAKRRRGMGDRREDDRRDGGLH